MSTEMRHSHPLIAGRPLHVVESGDPQGRPYLLLHGWPESWRTWEGLMAVADARVIAIDLPGIGESAPGDTGGSKWKLAEIVNELVERLDLADLTLVGHDCGGMIAYAYLRRGFAGERVVVMNTVIPGVDPWKRVLANPYIWHFGFHTVPGLPEEMVRGRQAAYFDYFYDVLSTDPARITRESRDAQVAAYADDAALTAGFDFYRAFTQDAKDNEAAAGPVDTPLLYLRGEGESGDMALYAQGFRDAGVRNLTTAVIPGVGHFAQEEAPVEVWRILRGQAG